MSTDTAHGPRTASEQSTTLGAVARGRIGTALLVAAYLAAHALALLTTIAVAVSLAAFLPPGALGVVGFGALGLGAVAAAPAVTRRAFAALVSRA